MSSDYKKYFIDPNGQHMILMLPPLPLPTQGVTWKCSEGTPPIHCRHDVDCIMLAAVSPDTVVQIPLLCRAADPRIAKYNSLSLSLPLLYNSKWATMEYEHNLPPSSPASNICDDEYCV